MVVSLAPVEKFRDYVFKPGATHGKDQVFRLLGYDISHSEELARLYEQQATDKYGRQDCVLGVLDQHGQRVSIEIEVPGIGEHQGHVSYLVSGWMIRSDDSLTLNTPFSGFSRERLDYA